MIQRLRHESASSPIHAVDHCTCIRVHAAPPRGGKNRKEKKVKTPIVAISIAVDGSAPLRRVNAKRKYAPPYLSSTHASTDLCGVPPLRGSTVLALSLLALRGSTPCFLFFLWLFTCLPADPTSFVKNAHTCVFLSASKGLAQYGRVG